MDFEQLRIFMVLAEERTFLGAANRLRTSRSRVRRKLDQLEADAGTALVVREPSGLRLTAAGDALVRRGRALLEDADQLIAHVRDVGEAPTGRLVVALPFAPTPRGWDEACRIAQERYPQLALDLRHTEDPIGCLPGEAEIALGFDDTWPEGTRAVEIAEFSLRLVVSDAYLARHGLPEHADDLAHHRIGLWRVANHPIDRLPLHDGRQLVIQPRFVSDDPARVFQTVIDGRCIGYLPDLPSLDDPALKPLFPDVVAGRVRQHLVVPDILADLPRVQRFLEICLSATRGADVP